MSSAQYINGLLHHLGEQLELEDLELDETGFCGLELEDLNLQINMELVDEADLFCLHTDLGEYYPREQDSLFPMLLEANLYHQQTDGATLAIDSQRNQVVLCLTRAIQELRDYPQFEKLVQGFIESSSQWAEKLDTMG